MDFRKMVTTILYVRQQKRHRCIEQSFGLCGRGRGWHDGRMALKHVYHIRNELPVQVRCRMLGAGVLGWPRGMVQGGRWEGGSGWGTRVHTRGGFMLMHGKTNTILQSNYPPIKINKFKLKKRTQRFNLCIIFKTIKYLSNLCTTWGTFSIASLKYSIIVCSEVSIMYWRTKITDLNLYLD